MQLLVVQTAFLGDVVLTTPLLREIRRAIPSARVTVVVTPGGRRLLAGLPYVDRTLVLHKRWNARGWLSWGGLAARLFRERYDIAIAAQRSTRTGQMLWLSGAGVRVGFRGAAGAWSYDHAVEWDASRHAVRRWLDLAGPIGGDPAAADPQPELSVDAAAEERVASLLRGAGIDDQTELLCVAPGSMRPTKRWSEEGFARLIELSASKGRATALVGTPDERELCQRIALRSGADPLVLAGRTGIEDFVALIERADAVVANDSAAGHVASAVGTPVLSIFGPTSPDAGFAPPGRANRVVQLDGLECRPCDARGPRACPLEHFRCMRELPAERVHAALEELLRDGGLRERRAQAGVRPG